MEKLTLIDTSIGSTNRGDDIIMHCIKEEMEEVLRKYHVLHVSSHLRNFHALECIGALPDSANEISCSRYKVVCGTNLLSNNMFHRSNQWNIGLLDCRPIEGAVLMGVGALAGTDLNWYTKKLYRKVLSRELIHSVREKKAEKIVSDLGLRCLNTGCPTLWKLTPEFCEEIPTHKKNSVVVTLTDYRRDIERDRLLIDIVKKKYDQIYFWPQGIYDVSYLKSIADIKGIEVIPANVKAFEEVLKKDVDYVGTRMHAGIFAMRHKVRSVIVSLDERMDSMAVSMPQNTISCKKLDQLHRMIDMPLETAVQLNWTAIDVWKDQFCI